jgi:hypothetical protein
VEETRAVQGQGHIRQRGDYQAQEQEDQVNSRGVFVYGIAGRISVCIILSQWQL